MKQTFSPETEQQLRADVNLREALRRRYAEEPQLPDNFALKLQKRMAAEREQKTVNIRPQRWRNVAASVAGAVLVSGMVYAAVQWGFSRQGKSPECSDAVAATKKEMPTAEGDSLVCFRNARLDSLLLVVGSHYRHAVVFTDEEPKALRFSIDWNQEKPLADFVSIVNEFEGLHLTAKRDTLYVESVEQEDEP